MCFPTQAFCLKPGQEKSPQRTLRPCNKHTGQYTVSMMILTFSRGNISSHALTRVFKEVVLWWTKLFVGSSARGFYLQWSYTVPPKCNNGLSRMWIGPILLQFLCHWTMQDLRPTVSEALVFNFFWEPKNFPEEMENSLTLTNWLSFSLHGLQMSPRGLYSQAESHGD